MKFTKLKLIALSAGLFCACAAVGGCTSDGSNASGNGGNTPNGSVAGASVTREEAYGLGAASCASLLADSLDAVSAGTFASAVKAIAADFSDDIKVQAENFNKYFAALNSFLDDSALKIETVTNTDADYAEYSTKLTVNGKDVAGNATNYVMYYNETYVKTKADKDEVEDVYTVTGVMLIDGNEYAISGGKKIETEGSEREEELKIRAYTGASTGDYVEMEQEYSTEVGETESEYVYRIYSDYKLVEETSVEFETENKNGKTETEFELEFLSGGAKGKYKVERETVNGVTQISVKYNLNGKQGKFKIKEIERGGEIFYEYTFEDNSTSLKKR